MTYLQCKLMWRHNNELLDANKGVTPGERSASVWCFPRNSPIPGDDILKFIKAGQAGVAGEGAILEARSPFHYNL